jgi:uncharacterized membrane protein YdbT with pleckstrin-like domain
MIFKTKRDSFFVVFYFIILIIINAVFIIPIFFVEDTKAIDYFIVFTLDLIITGFMIWVMIDMSYEFKEDYLLVKCGIIRSKIRYIDITKLTMNTNIWVGYRVLSSRDAIELHYKTGLLGSVKISPEQKELFIEELQKRNKLINIKQNY